MLNPILYAFLSEHFRKGFQEAFKCQIDSGNGNKSMIEEQSNFEKIRSRMKTKQTNLEIDTKTGNISHRVLPEVTDNTSGNCREMEKPNKNVINNEFHVYDGTDYEAKENYPKENSALINHHTETDFKKSLIVEDESDDKNSVTYIDRGSQTKLH